MRRSIIAVICCLLSTAMAAERFAELDPARIAAIAALLPERPAGFGRPINDRAYWSHPDTLALVGKVVADAEKLVGKEFPAWDDALYLEFSKMGRRPPGERMMKTRHGWLRPLVLAECVEAKGRFLPTIAIALEEYLRQPTWTIAAHDRNLANFQRKSYSVDLVSALFAADLATALHLLDDRLDADLRRRVDEAIHLRVLTPMRRSYVTGKGHGWLGSKAQPVQNNWNAVCLSGAVGAALAIIPDRTERAVHAAAAEHYSTYFLNGFHSDGYCDEGGGYWSYGFGNFAVLREELIQSTGGRIDLFLDPKIRNIALFGVRFQMNDRLVPPFADCRAGSRANVDLVAYCNQVMALGLPGLEGAGGIGRASLATALMRPTPCAAKPGTATAAALVDVRSFFDQAGVLVCRPSSPTCRLAAAMKAGGNSSHSHNDIGSFVIALGSETIVGEPGGPHAYNDKTFGPQRYTFKMLNSFGHPVPVVAGQLQVDATKVKPPVLGTAFSDAQDEMRIDLKPAYQVPTLAKLERTMRFVRTGVGAVRIEDVVAFTQASAFEVCLTTRATHEQVDATTLVFTAGKERLQVVVTTPDGFELTSEAIEEFDAPPFTRLGLKLTKPVTATTVTMVFTPLP